MRVRAYIYHKRSEKYSDCQDRFDINFDLRRIAISDGMSQSIFPHWWAELLVKAYLDTGELPQDITPYQETWYELVKKEIERKESEGNDPWMLKNMLNERKGAGATVCGFSWNESEWKCECLGDSSLIVVDQDYKISIFTSQTGKFGYYPDYFDSFNKGRGEIKSFEGNFDNVLAILLVTDPFSELFQKYSEDAEFLKERMNELQDLSDHESYVKLVEDWRSSWRMHDDDSTLILLTDINNLICEKNASDNFIDDLNSLSENTNEIEIKNEFKVSFEKEEERISQSSDRQKEIVEIIQENVREWLLNYYSGKKNRKKIKEKIISLIKPVIDDFIR